MNDIHAVTLNGTKYVPAEWLNQAIERAETAERTLDAWGVGTTNANDEILRLDAKCDARDVLVIKLATALRHMCCHLTDSRCENSFRARALLASLPEDFRLSERAEDEV